MLIRDYFDALYGHPFGKHDLVALFSVRLDEAGTGGHHPYTVVAGAIATVDEWASLERKWERLLGRNNVSAYHRVDFKKRRGDFDGWSQFQQRRFIQAQERIITSNTRLRISVGVDRAAHCSVKERMRGITGFRARSDYSLCLQYLMHHACEVMASVDAECRLSVMIEQGPWAKGAYSVYEHIAALRGRSNAAKHSRRLAGFAVVPKGERRSLEAADYIVGTELDLMMAWRTPPKRDAKQRLLLTAPLLEKWYRGMLKEYEKRRAYGQRKFIDGAPLSERPF